MLQKLADLLALSKVVLFVFTNLSLGDELMCASSLYSDRVAQVE